jgi:hypothetical protein
MKSAGASAYAEIVASYLIKIAFQDEPTARSCSKIPIRRKPIFVLGEPGRLTPPPALISSGALVCGPSNAGLRPAQHGHASFGDLISPVLHLGKPY